MKLHTRRKIYDLGQRRQSRLLFLFFLFFVAFLWHFKQVCTIGGLVFAVWFFAARHLRPPTFEE